MRVQNINITVHFYLTVMVDDHIAKTVHTNSPLMPALSHSVQGTVILLWSLHTCFLQLLYFDFKFHLR